MPRTEKQYEEIRESRKAEIMEVALELFASEGYYSTSISKIANRAGISKGLMYNYFESKERLITEIMNEGIEKIIFLLDPDHDGVLTRDEMEYFVHETFQLMKENFEYWKLYFATAIQTPVIKLISAKLTDLVPRFLGMLMAYYQKQGSENPRGEALLFGAMLDGIGFNYIMAPNTFPLEEMEDLVIKRFCRNNMNKQEPENKKN